MLDGLDSLIYIAAEGTHAPGESAFGAIILSSQRPTDYRSARFRRTTLNRAALLGAVEAIQSSTCSNSLSIIIRTDCSFLANAFRHGIPVRSSRAGSADEWRPNQDLLRRIAQACPCEEPKTVWTPPRDRLIQEAHDLARRALEDGPAMDDPAYSR